MKITTWLMAVAICVGFTGCSIVREAAMPVYDKVNAVHSVSPEARIAREHVVSLLADDPKASATFKIESDARMLARAKTCMKNVPISRFASLASVRSVPMSADCFNEQDRELQQFYGIRTVGLLLAKPPLRPLKPVGRIAALPQGKLSHLHSGAFARDAGVGTLSDVVGDTAVIEVPSGALIARLLPKTAGMSAGLCTRVSPNGHVVVLCSTFGQGPVFYDAETGHRIWESAETGHVLTWLPEVNGFVFAANSGSAMLVDGEAGTMTPHPLTLENSAFGIHLPGESSRALIGTAREFKLIEHTRTSEGIRASLVKSYAITSGQGITSGHPLPMRSGRMIVYVTDRDVGWLDLETGQSGTWRSAPYFGNTLAKLDENHIMFDSTEIDRMTLKPWSFDITAGTVAQIDLGGDRGLIVDIGDRVGFMRRGSEAWFGDQVTTITEPASLDTVVAAYELQLQLAKLRTQPEVVSSMEAAHAPVTSILPARKERKIPRR